MMLCLALALTPAPLLACAIASPPVSATAPTGLPVTAPVESLATAPAGLLATAPAEPRATAQAGSLAIRADVVWLGDRRVLEKGIVIVSEGRITDVGTNIDVPAGTATVEHKGALTAGMIALHGYNGAPKDLRDDARPSMPAGRTARAFDAAHDDFEGARNSGITTLVLTPLVQGVVPGVSAVVKSSGGTVMVDEAQLSLVFTAEGLTYDREPTSTTGAVMMLEQLFASPHGAIERAADGKLPCLFETTERSDVARAIAFAKEHKLSGAIHGCALAGELADQIRDAKLDVILPALGVGTERRALKAVIALQKAGVRFGFGLDSPLKNPAQLRLGAAQCVREGLMPQAAWSALTSDAARIAGVGDRVGRIERGFEADLVLWSGNPLDLGSRVEAVLVGGVQVFGGDR